MNISVTFSFDIYPAPTIRIVDILSSEGGVFVADEARPTIKIVDAQAYCEEPVVITSGSAAVSIVDVLVDVSSTPTFTETSATINMVDVFMNTLSGLTVVDPPVSVNFVGAFLESLRPLLQQQLGAVIDYDVADRRTGPTSELVSFDIAQQGVVSQPFYFNIYQPAASVMFDFDVVTQSGKTNALFEFDVTTAALTQQSVSATFEFDVTEIPRGFAQALFSYDVVGLIAGSVSATFSFDIVPTSTGTGGGAAKVLFDFDVMSRNKYLASAGSIRFNILELWIPISMPCGVVVRHGSQPKSKTTMNHVYCRVYQGNIFVGTAYKVFSTTRNAFGIQLSIRDIPELTPDMRVVVFLNGRQVLTDVGSYSPSWSANLWLLPE